MSPARPWEAAISYDDVCAIYDDVMAKFGGRRGIRSPECVHACLGNAWTAQAYLADDHDESPWLLFAAYLMCYLIGDHCFTDGNKRVGWASMTFVLQRQFELTVDAPTSEIVEMIEDFVGKRLKALDVVRWVATRLVDASTA